MSEKCFYCECQLTREGDNRRTKDHIIPKSQGGRGQRGLNVVISCFKCNQLKASYTLEYFIFFVQQFGSNHGYTPAQITTIVGNCNWLIEHRIKRYGKMLLKKEYRKE